MKGEKRIMGFGTAVKAIAGAIKNRSVASTIKAAAQAGLKGRGLARLGRKALSASVKKTAARAAVGTAFAASITKQAEAREAEAKARSSSMSDALARYNTLINMTSQPAEGTGNASTGASTGGNNGGVYPVGN